MPKQWRKVKQNTESLIQNDNAIEVAPERTGFQEKPEPRLLNLANQLLNSSSVLVSAKPPISIRGNLLVCDRTVGNNHIRRLLQTS